MAIELRENDGSDASSPVTLEDVLGMERIFEALADETRLNIVLLLLQGQECKVIEICRHLGEFSQPTVSHHLRILLNAGVVQRRPEGKFSYYSLGNDSAFFRAIRFIGYLRTPVRKAAETLSDDMVVPAIPEDPVAEQSSPNHADIVFESIRQSLPKTSRGKWRHEWHSLRMRDWVIAELGAGRSPDEIIAQTKNTLRRNWKITVS